MTCNVNITTSVVIVALIVMLTRRFLSAFTIVDLRLLSPSRPNEDLSIDFNNARAAFHCFPLSKADITALQVTTLGKIVNRVPVQFGRTFVDF